MATKPKILIVEARFYDDLADELARGATEALDRADVLYDRIAVPGALEIPLAVSMGASTQLYSGYVALGCVIRGETSHYDIVAIESARALQNLALERQLIIGNGILTVENGAQAWARARISEKNKGGFAANVVLSMLALKKQFGLG